MRDGVLVAYFLIPEIIIKMKRRTFIQTSATAISLISASTLGVVGSVTNDGSAGKEIIDPIIPFRFYANRKEVMLSQMIAMREQYGLRRFLLTAPMDEVRLTGFPPPEVYREIGELVLFVKTELAPHDIEVGWWCAPSLRSGNGDFQYITDIDGSVSDASPCPLGQKFRETFSDNIATVVKISRPFMIQFEDDFELSWQPPTVKFGCFCPLHLAEFAKQQNKYYSRQELSDIFSRVNPQSIMLRRAWAELSRDSLAGFAGLIRDKVDRIAPETRISLCQSGSADFDGDFTEAVARAFAGKTRPAVRLYGSSYSSDDAASLPETMFHALYSRQHLPSDFEFYHESDTYPHTRFFMSAAKIKSLMTAAFAYRFDDSLFYATQYLDNPTEEAGYLGMFRLESGRFLALKQAVKNTRVEGCEIVYDPFGHVANPFTGKRPNLPSNAWVNITGRFGIPHTSLNGKVKLVSGNITETMDDEAIRKLLGGSVFLDGKADFNICKRGFGELLGTEVMQGKEADFCYEGIRNLGDFSNIHGSLMYNLIFAPAGSEGGSFFVLKPADKAEILSDFLDAAEKPVIPGMIRFKNKSGGRVAITAFDLNGNRSSTVFNYKKKELVRQTIEWLGNEQIPVFVKDLPNVFCIFNRSNEGNYAVVTLMSLCSDAFESFSLDVASEWQTAKLELLDKQGQWQTADKESSGRTIKVNAALILMTPVILKFTRKV